MKREVLKFFTMQQLDLFRKLLQNLQGKDCDEDHF